MQHCRIGGNYGHKTTREKKREIQREKTVMDKAFDSLFIEFCYILFTKDLTDVKIFEKYNEAWFQYAEQWNKDNRKVLKCDVHRFQKYAIDK